MNPKGGVGLRGRDRIRARIGKGFREETDTADGLRQHEIGSSKRPKMPLRRSMLRSWEIVCDAISCLISVGQGRRAGT
jgi:hypothetical protein